MRKAVVARPVLGWRTYVQGGRTADAWQTALGSACVGSAAAGAVLWLLSETWSFLMPSRNGCEMGCLELSFHVV